MAAILKLRRGSTTPTSLEQSELFYNSTLGTLQVGKSSANNDNITLVKLTDVNTGNLQIVGTISGSRLNLSGDITASNLSLSGNATIAGNITFGGELITLGDANTDNIVISGELSSSLIPNNDNAFDLGSTDKKYRNVYAYNINGSVTDTKLLQFTASEESKNSTLATYTGSVDSKLTNLINVTGSYATTGSNNFIGNQNITGSLVTSGSKVEFNVAWPTAPSEQHIIKTDGFTINGRTYDYAGFALEHFEDSPGTYHNAFSMYMFDPTYSYGSEFLVGPFRNHMRVFPSGSISGINSANISVEDLNNGTSVAKVYGDNIEIGVYNSEKIKIGNNNSSIEIYADVTSSHQITAPLFSGSIYGISDTLNFSQSVDFRLDSLEINSGSVNNSIALLNTFSQSQETKDSTLASYTASIDSDITELYSTASNHELRTDRLEASQSAFETAIGLNGSNVTINGDLSVLGTTTQINSTQVNIGENILELNYGGAVTKGGIFVTDATGNSASGSLLWNSVTDRWIAGPSGSESTILLAGGDNVVSGSAQINLIDTADYVSAIKNRLSIESVISSSVQVDVYNTTNFISYSSSVDSKLVQLANDSASQDGRLDNLELFSSSEENKNSTLATYTGSNDTKWDVLGSVTESLINATSSYETKGRDIVSGSSQLTASYDLRYAQSQSFSNLVGAWDYGTQGSIRDAAFYSVTSSAQLDTGSITSGSLNDTFIFTAGATKEYVNWRTEAILDAIGAADITAVGAGSGLSGGGTSGDVSLTLDTASLHFTNGVKTKLNIEGVISGSSQIFGGSGLLSSSNETFNTFSASVDGRIDILELFSGSQETKNSTLATYTASIDAKNSTLETYTASLETKNSTLASYTGSVNTNLTNLNSFSSSIDTTIKTKLNAEGVLSGSSQVFGGSGLLSSSNETFNTFSASVDDRLDIIESFSSSINTTIKTKLDVEGVISGSSQIVNILGPLNTFSASQETKDSTLASYTGSVDAKFSTIGSLTGSYATTGSNVFNGTQTISGSVFITQDLIVQGSSSIQTISSSRLDIGDNIVQLNVNSPSLRFGGLAIIDSGSVGSSGSFLYDSVQDEFIFVHKGNGTNVTSSHFVMGPETYDDLGNEIYLTTNRVPKGTGNEHLNDSNITDTGTLITLGSNTTISGTIYSSGTPLVSGSSQITLASTTGFGTYLNQAVLTTSNVQFNSLGVGMAASATAGRIDATNDIVAYSSSDKNFKENIKPIENALEKINQIGGYEFDWKEENKLEHGYEGHDLGVIAQEIELIAPELVQTRENGYKAVKYDKLVSVLIQAIKELSAKVTELEKK